MWAEYIKRDHGLQSESYFFDFIIRDVFGYNNTLFNSDI